MKRVWKFISQPQNLAVLIAIGGLLSFLYTHFLAPTPLATAQPTAPAPVAGAASATTGDNGIVIQNATAGGDIRVGEK